jgi:hypothetical protein
LRRALARADRREQAKLHPGQQGQRRLDRGAHLGDRDGIFLVRHDLSLR